MKWRGLISLILIKKLLKIMRKFGLIFKNLLNYLIVWDKFGFESKKLKDFLWMRLKVILWNIVYLEILDGNGFKMSIMWLGVDVIVFLCLLVDVGWRYV